MKWSYSAHTTMRRCQRALALQQVVASAQARDPIRREAHILKQLQQISAWRGSLVHAVMAREFLAAIRGRVPVDPAALTAVAVERARAQFAFSAAKRYRAKGQTKTAAGAAYCALAEHDQDQAIALEQVTELETNLARCFDHLAQQTELLKLIREGQNHQTELRLFFRLDETTVAATLDLVFETPNGRLVIVDWKSGESETSDYRRQLQVYTLVALRSDRWSRLRLTPEAIDLYEVNLLSNQVTPYRFDAADIEDGEDFVYRSSVDMRALLGDASYDTLDWDNFDVAARPTTCRICTLAPLCVELFTRANKASEAAAIQGRLF